MIVPLLIEGSVGATPGGGIHLTVRTGRGVAVVGLTTDDARWLASKLLDEAERADRTEGAASPGTRRTAPPPAAAGVDEPARRRAGR